jgi:hypothetical protein
VAHARPNPDDEEERNLLSVIRVLEARVSALRRRSRRRVEGEKELRAARDRLEQTHGRGPQWTDEERNLMSVVAVLEARLASMGRRWSRRRAEGEKEPREARDRLKELSRRRKPP